MTQPSMPVLESVTRPWPDLEAAHERATGAAAALLDGRAELLAALTRLATCASARDELLRSLRAVAGAPWELARTGVPQLARVSVVLPQDTALYSYVRHCLVPALYCDEVVVRPTPRIRETALEVHRTVSRGLDPARWPPGSASPTPRSTTSRRSARSPTPSSSPAPPRRPAS